MASLAPTDEAEVRAAVADALAGGRPLEVVGLGSKRSLGRPMQTAAVLGMGAIRGVVDYAPEELVLTARAGTRLSEVEELLARHGQMLAFEPPDLGPLLEGEASEQTLGGVVAANLAGPRRFKAGAARDHVLGVRLVTGRADSIKAGGKVVKNVTGYDLCKLVCGSFGTLGVVTEISVRVAPRPEKTRTLLAYGLAPGDALKAFADLAAGQLDPSASAWMPAHVAARSAVSHVAGVGASVAAVRVEGPATSTLERARLVKELLGAKGPVEELHGRNSGTLWREVGGAHLLRGAGASLIWRVTLPPASCAKAVSAVGGDILIDGGGNTLWVAIESPANDGGAPLIRGMARGAGAVAQLVKAPPDVRAAVEMFEPLEPGLAVLTRRVKEAFDPRGIFNPGRMYAGV